MVCFGDVASVFKLELFGTIEPTHCRRVQQTLRWQQKDLVSECMLILCLIPQKQNNSQLIQDSNLFLHSTWPHLRWKLNSSIITWNIISKQNEAKFVHNHNLIQQFLHLEIMIIIIIIIIIMMVMMMHVMFHISNSSPKCS
jgi:hypothetical protein